MKKLLITLVMITGLLSMYSCSSKQNSQSDNTISTRPTEETTTDDESAEPATQTTIKKDPEIFTYNYVHGEDGYFNLLSETPEFKTKLYEKASCWAYAAAFSLETSYAVRTGNSIKIDPNNVINTLWDTNKSDGFIKKADVPNSEMGGNAWMVTETLSRGFGDITLESAVILTDKGIDDLKGAIRSRGGIYANIPENPDKKEWYGDYITMNDPRGATPSHPITIIGWDDNFPKNYFTETASQDGAWIAYNSTEGMLGSYFYISYDTPLNDIVSFRAADKYSAILSYDVGNENDRYIKRGEETTVANVFHSAGKLSAIGTYNNFDEVQNIKIEIYDSSFRTLMYSQDSTLNYHGYQTIDLDTPVNVVDYAIVITYSKGAPVEGETINSEKYDYVTSCSSGQSYVFLGDWKNKASIFHAVEVPEGEEEAPAVDHTYDYIKDIKDMSDGNIREALGIDFTPNNCCIKALYTY